MRIALLVAGLALAGGCEGKLNQAYCAQPENRADKDCLEAGYVRFDAPPAECDNDPGCAGNPNGSVCDVANQRCVTCIDNVNETACSSMMQVCGPDQKCHGCIVDTDCASAVCLASRSCAMESNVLYARPGGSGTTCTKTAPCAFSEAVNTLAPQRQIIKLTTLAGNEYTDPPVTIDKPYPVQIIGTGTRFVPAGAGSAITASGASLEVLGMAIDGADGSGVRCTAGALTLQEMTISNNAGWGVEASACDVRLLRSRMSGNPSGAVSAIGGTHSMRNNVMNGNGNTSLDAGNVHFENATGRFVFNTVADNISRSGGSRTGGIGCTAAPGGTFVIAQNIVVAWGNAGDAISVGCSARDNFINGSAASVRFDDTRYHLSAQSPAEVLDVQSVLVDGDCKDEDQPVDIDGQSRPFNNYCDRGADEYRP